MRLDANKRHEVAVALSRRNLLSLLERTHDERRSTISQTVGATPDFVFLTVKAEQDEEHYEGRERGAVHLNSQVVLQIAVDLIQQVADSLDDFPAEALDRLATQVAYINNQMDHERMEVV